MKVAVRGFGIGEKIFEEIVDIDSDLSAIILSQVDRLKQYRQYMIEIEFIEEPENPYRFFRFGTDPSGMVLPLELDWDKVPKV